MPTDRTPCPCGRPVGDRPGAPVRAYGDCCGRWHAGPLHLQAPDAESLMRSRYSAFVRGLGDYLLATWHPDTRPSRLEADEPGLKWLGLEVRQHQQAPAPDGGPAGEAWVEFVARSRLGGRAHRLHERSRFRREADGRWYYLDGEFIAPPAR